MRRRLSYLARSLPVIALTAALTLLGGCSSGLFSIHKIDVQQGNALREDSVKQLKIGMTAKQVRFLLGNPLLHDSFHPDRWDYLYYLDPGKGETQERKLTVFFDGNTVSRIDKGDS